MVLVNLVIKYVKVNRARHTSSQMSTILYDSWAELELCNSVFCCVKIKRMVYLQTGFVYVCFHAFSITVLFENSRALVSISNHNIICYFRKLSVIVNK